MEPVATSIEEVDEFLRSVVRVSLHRVSVPLRAALGSAHGVEHRRESTLVHAERRDGHEGWGECVALARPTYTSEYAAAAYAVLRDVLVPTLLADGPPGLRSIVGHPMAQAALEGAAVDAGLRAADRSFAEYLGVTRTTVPTAAVIGQVGSVDEVMARLGAWVDQGVSAVSLKVSPGWDLEPLRAVRSAWPDLTLAADANGAYRRSDVDRLDALAAVGLHHIEQPLPADDLVGLAEVRARIGAPIALDESIQSPHDLDAALRAGSLDAVNIKPARLGGLSATLAVIDLASAHGLSLYGGGMLETGVGRAHAIAVAAVDQMRWPTHLGPSERYFERDLTNAIVLDDEGALVLPSGPGIGVVPDPARLAEVETDQDVISAPDVR